MYCVSLYENTPCKIQRFFSKANIETILEKKKNISTQNKRRGGSNDNTQCMF